MDSMYADDAMRAMLATTSQLCKLFPKPLQVLEDIRPFVECPVMLFRNPIKPERIEIVTSQIRSLLFGLVGDCYRIDKQYETAAYWYQHASTFYKGGGYPVLYARMVIQFSLIDHYQSAYECIRFANRELSHYCWLYLLKIYVQCFMKTPIWYYKTMLQTWFMNRSYERELARRTGNIHDV